MKLNTDGSSRANPSEAGRARCGGRFRNDKREWVTGFFCRLPDCSVFEAELRAIYRGLVVVYGPIYMDTDFKLAEEIIQFRRVLMRELIFVR